MNHIYFIGIAGIGVSALAQVAQAQGIRVSGSDPQADPQTNPAAQRLQKEGATLYRKHRAENLEEDVELVVASAAIHEDNPEIQAARQRGIPVMSRAEFLGALMDRHRGVKIAVAGTHGKTTTTAMIGFLLQDAGLNPTVFVGGEVTQIGGNARIGSETGPFVVEACEAYDSFLHLRPDIAIVTNIEADHLDHFGTFERVLESFRRFVENVTPETGKLIFCEDDAGARQLLASLPQTPELRGYGIDTLSAVSRAKNVEPGRRTTFTWQMTGSSIAISLGVPGRHNVLNALAAVTLCRELGITKEIIATGLAEFRGVERRQEVLGEVVMSEEGSVLVMDDYAHHPTEIRATLDALRAAYPQRRLIVLFQPHLYSRTRDFLDEFATTLAQADVLFLTDIYAAREEPIPGVRADCILDNALQAKPELLARYVPNKENLPAELAALIQPGDLALFLGAGDIREPGEAFVRLLRQSSRREA